MKPIVKQAVRFAHGRIYFGENRTQWSLHDPTKDGLVDSLRELHGAAYDNLSTGAHSGEQASGRVEVNREALKLALGLVSDYLHFATYELGVEHVTRQLRELRRALREAGRAQ